jgi:glycosyltransferase involved in cell wall biosynthesis
VVLLWNLKRLTVGCAPPAEWPLLSVIVPARDEGEKIEAAMRSLLALDYPNLEIIAVDDRSRDATGAILDRIADEDHRLKITHLTELPAGWLGKCHALHTGAQQARGKILLFTDGDVVFSPQALRLAVTYLLRKPLGHLCLNPQLIPGGYWENALVACFGLLFFAAFKPWLIPTRWPRAYCGIGAFNLVRREAYWAVGGHERIRLDVLDDVNLGKILKQSGCRQEMLLGGDLIKVRWQNSFWGVIKGLEKNSFAAVHYSVAELIGVTILFLIVFFGPYAGAATGLALGENDRVEPYLLTVILLHASYATIGIRVSGGALIVPALPATFAMFIFLMWRSAWITLRQGGVTWRDTFYSLADLRQNQLP